jgi:hypothetical protein
VAFATSKIAEEDDALKAKRAAELAEVAEVVAAAEGPLQLPLPLPPPPPSSSSFGAGGLPTLFPGSTRMIASYLGLWVLLHVDRTHRETMGPFMAPGPLNEVPSPRLEVIGVYDDARAATLMLQRRVADRRRGRAAADRLRVPLTEGGRRGDDSDHDDGAGPSGHLGCGDMCFDGDGQEIVATEGDYHVVRLPWPVSNEPADQPKDSIPLLCGRNGGGGGGEGSCPVEDRAFVVLHEYSNTGHGEAGLGTIGGDGVAADKRTAGWLARRTFRRYDCPWLFPRTVNDAFSPVSDQDPLECSEAFDPLDNTKEDEYWRATSPNGQGDHDRNHANRRRRRWLRPLPAEALFGHAHAVTPGQRSPLYTQYEAMCVWAESSVGRGRGPIAGDAASEGLPILRHRRHTPSEYKPPERRMDEEYEGTVWVEAHQIVHGEPPPSPPPPPPPPPPPKEEEEEEDTKGKKEQAAVELDEDHHQQRSAFVLKLRKAALTTKRRAWERCAPTCALPGCRQRGRWTLEEDAIWEALRREEIEKKKKKKKKTGDSRSDESVLAEGDEDEDEDEDGDEEAPLPHELSPARGSYAGVQSCSKCKVASYCSRAHQKEDWERHKPWCVVWRRTHRHQPGTCLPPAAFTALRNREMGGRGFFSYLL